MRRSYLIPLLATCFVAGLSQAQNLPGSPEDNGLSPRTDTFYVNTPDTINNGQTESLGVAISPNSNVIIGWEDDGDGLSDLEAVWTIYDGAGARITPETKITSLVVSDTLDSHFLSYFRADKSPIPGNTAWGAKIKANLFGDGLGMGATAYDLGKEVAGFAGYQDTGDAPAVQLLGNAGEPGAILAGVPVDYAARDGNIRVGDWDYLSTGNLAIAGESRQNQDLVDIYGGTDPQTHAIVRVVSPSGAEVKAVQLVSAVPEKSEMWHGLGVTKNGFGVRFADANGRATVRLFDNAGTPVTTNLDLGQLTGFAAAAGGGRGDGAGFHGNGQDAYVAACAGTDEQGDPVVWVTVLNADGTVRFSHSVADDLTLTGPKSADAAIDGSGRVIVVFDDTSVTDGAALLVMGRIFDAAGKPLGGTFYVSEKELPQPATLEAAEPRIAWRGDTVAIVWQSKNSGSPDLGVVAARLFSVSVMGGLDSVGLARIVPDTVIYNTGADNHDNWEPYASVLGTSTFLVEANTFAENDTENQRFALAFQPVAGGAAALGEAFFADDGTPFKGPINASRQDGNPGRIAGDRRPGAVNFMDGAESSPHTIAAFQSDNRWNLGFDRGTDDRYASVETFKLDPATLTQTPLSKAFDATYGRQTSGTSDSQQITRFGGHIVALDNGNFAVVVEDRSKVMNPDGNAAVATIVAPDGSIVKESFVVANGDLWANAAAFKGGFAVRVAGIIHFLNNAGTELGTVDQDTSGVTFDRGRGDDVRLGGHINMPYVYLVGVVADTIQIAAFDARDQTFVAGAVVATAGDGDTFARADVDSDALGRVAVAYEVQPKDWEQSQVALRVFAIDGAAKQLNPLTEGFFPFINYARTGIHTTDPTVAMTTRQILVAAKGEVNSQNKPELGPDTPKQTTLYTVFAHPNPADDPTPAVPGGGLAVTAALDGSNVVLTWTGGTAPFKVQQRSSLSAGSWADVLTTSDHTATVPADGAIGFLQVVGQ